MKTTKRLLAVLLTLVLLCVGVPFAANATTIVASEPCGDNLTWTLDSDGLLTISGTGAMKNYSSTYDNGVYRTTAPWGQYYRTIQTVVIEFGVTSIGSDAFYGCTSLESVTIPNSVTSIGDYAFEYCSSLTSMTIPDGVTFIGYYAFSYCSSLTSVTIPDSVTSIDSSTFAYCTSLENVTIPNSVTSISDSAFAGCSSLQSVTIGSGVETISSSAFSHCSALNTIVVSSKNSWYSSSDGVLYNKDKTTLFICPKTKTEFTIPDSVTSIDEDAFEDCTVLKTLTIGKGVRDMTRPNGYDCFGTCTSLKAFYVDEENAMFASDENGILYSKDYSVLYRCPPKMTKAVLSFSSQVKTISGHAFDSCKYLCSAVIPDGVTEIGVGAFMNCSNLASVVIPNSVTVIEYVEYTGRNTGLFENCSHLMYAVIGSGVTSIVWNMFNNCTSLESVTIPDSVTSIENYAFSGCTALKDVYYTSTPEDWVAITINDSNTALSNATIHYNYQSDNYFIDSGTCGGNLTWMFDSDGTLTISGTGAMNGYSYTYDNGVYRTTAPWGQYYRIIQTVVIESSVTSIGSDAFYGCTSLESVTIPNSVTRIGDSAFRSCTALQSMMIPDSVTSIGDSAFCGCTSLGNVTIGNSVTSIGDSAFSNCTALESVTIPDSVTNIDFGAFAYCISLENVIIGQNITCVGTYVFAGCTSLQSVIIPDSVTRIDNQAFSSCTALESVVIPNSVTYIDFEAFNGCTSLKSVTIGNSVTSIVEGTFADCTSLQSVTIGNSVTSIGREAFCGCTSLGNVTIGNSVTSIGEGAFSNCTALESVTIPDSVTNIENYAFEYCSSLTDVYYTGSEADWNAISIGDYNVPLTNATIHYLSSDNYQVGDFVYFGTYPQTKVAETTALKNAANAAVWKSYDYYTGTGSWNDGKMTPGDYMKFADFFCNGTKYRAVKFTQYRPNGTGYRSDASSTNQDDNGYEPNTTYYFKYEPLTWRVLDPSTGYIMCENIVDAQAYQNTIYFNGSEYYQAINSSVYANDYATSSIRDWLNYDFYETAFTASQKENIKTTALNNDACSTDYAQYNSAATNDKIFLLSWADALNTSYGFSSSNSTSDTARRAQGTDYAKCQGLSVSTSSEYSGNSWWWLRSPAVYSFFACRVSDDGYASSYGSIVDYTSIGVRPACKISNLRSDISQSDNLFSAAAHEHQAGQPVVENEVAATCTQTGSYDTVIYCVICGEELSRETITVPTVEHTPGETVYENRVENNCTEPGSYDEVVYCTECDTELSRETIEIPAPGHSEKVISRESTCSENGYIITICLNCGETLSTEILPRLDHDWNDGVLTQEPTCTAQGVKTYTCLNCNASFTEPVDMLAHNWDAGVVTKEPSCTEAGEKTYTCTIGGETRTEQIEKKAHTPEIVSGTVPTCTEAGISDGVKCSACKQWLLEPQTLEPLDHDYQIGATVEASCTEEGYTPFVCSRCGDIVRTDLVDALGHKEDDGTVENEVAATCEHGGSYNLVIRCKVCEAVLKTDHIETSQLRHVADAPVKENEVAPTCTADGSYDSVVYCRNCHVELNRETVTVPATDHTYGKPEWLWSKSYHSATATFRCTSGDDEQTIVATVVEGASPDSTCENEGVMLHVATVEFNGELYTAIQKTSIQLKDHTAGEPVRENVVEPSCDKEGSYDEVVYCTECNAELSREKKPIDMIEHTPAEAVRENEVAATYTTEGSYEEVVYCTVCGAELSRETRTIPVVGHEHEYTVKVTKEPTCEEVGVKLYICSLCGDGYTEDIPKTAHEDTDNDGYCDTCEQQMTGGDHCKYCGKIHDGAFGWLVKFFHSILAIFKR